MKYKPLREEVIITLKNDKNLSFNQTEKLIRLRDLNSAILGLKDSIISFGILEGDGSMIDRKDALQLIDKWLGACLK